MIPSSLRDRLLGLVLEGDRPARALAPRPSRSRWSRSSTLTTRPSVWKSSVFRCSLQRWACSITCVDRVVAGGVRADRDAPALHQPGELEVRAFARSPRYSPSPCETNRSRRWPQSFGVEQLERAGRRVARVGERGLAGGPAQLVEPDQLGVGHVDLAAHLEQRRRGRPASDQRDLADGLQVGRDVVAALAVAAGRAQDEAARPRSGARPPRRRPSARRRSAPARPGSGPLRTRASHSRSSS